MQDLNTATLKGILAPGFGWLRDNRRRIRTERQMSVGLRFVWVAPTQGLLARRVIPLEPRRRW